MATAGAATPCTIAPSASSERRRRLVTFIAVAALVMAALLLRTAGLFSSSIWVDDIYSLSVAAGHSLDVRLPGMPDAETYVDNDGPVPAGALLAYLKPVANNRVAKAVHAAHASETHPPLFHAFLYFWLRIAGSTPAAGRVFSLLFAVATVPLLFLFARELAGERAAYIATGLLVLSPLQAQVAIQIRMYSMMLFLAVATTWLAWRMVCSTVPSSDPRHSEGQARKRAALYFALSVAGLLTHYFFVFYVAFHGLCFVTQRRLWRTAFVLGTGFAGVGAGLAVYLKTQPDFAAQPWILSAHGAGELLIGAGSFISDFFTFSPAATIPAVFAAPAWLVFMARLAMVLLLGWLLLAASRAPAPVAAFLLAWLAVPVVLVLALDLVRHTGTLIQARYLLGSAPALYILLAIGLARLPARTALPVAALLAIFIVFGHIALRRLPAGTLVEGADFKRAGATIENRWQPGDLIVVQTSYAPASIGVANYVGGTRPLLTLLYLPRPDPGVLTMRASDRDLPARLDRWTKGARRLWVIRSFCESSYAPLGNWLEKNGKTLHVEVDGSLVLREVQLTQARLPTTLP